MKKHGGHIEEQLNVSDKSLTAEVEELEKVIVTLETNIQDIKVTKNNYESSATAAIGECKKEIDKILSDGRNMVNTRVGIMFKELISGVVEQKGEQKVTIAGREQNGISSCVDFVLSRFYNRVRVREASFENLLNEFLKTGRLEFPSKDEYNSARDDIHATYSAMAKQVSARVLSSVQKIMDKTTKRMEDNFHCSFDAILNEARRALGDIGIEPVLAIPDINLGPPKESSVRLRKDVGNGCESRMAVVVAAPTVLFRQPVPGRNSGRCCRWPVPGPRRSWPSTRSRSGRI